MLSGTWGLEPLARAVHPRYPPPGVPLLRPSRAGWPRVQVERERVPAVLPVDGAKGE